MNLPNLVTLVRIALCPLVLHLALAGDLASRYLAFGVFVAAALTDVLDGRLARSRGAVTDLGKLLDPLADKLLLACSLGPLYVIGQRPDEPHGLPIWEGLPLWAVVVIFGREILVTCLRAYAAGNGVVIAAGRSGKYKTLVLCVFVAALLLWGPLAAAASEQGWSGGLWALWSPLHQGLNSAGLALALVLSLWSLADYWWSYRTVLSGPG